MTASDKVVFLDRAQSGKRRVETLEPVFRIASEKLMKALTTALDQVDDALFDRAERAGSNADQERYFVAMRQVRLNRRDIEERFHQAVGRKLSELTAPAAAQAPAPQEDHRLELMEEATVEEDVAIDSAVGRLRTRLSFPLRQLCSRLDDMSADPVDDERNPLDPKAAVSAFADAIGQLDIEIQPRIILYKLFEKQLLGALPPLYDEANRMLAEAGVLPDMRGPEPTSKHERTRPAPRSEVSASTWDPSHGGELAPEEAVEQQDGEALIRTLQALLQDAQNSQPSGARHRGVATPAAGTGSTADLNSVLQALSGLQQNRPASTQTVLAGDRLKGLVASSLAEQPGEQRNLERSTSDIIDIVSMLFDIILDDSRVHGSIKALIARLQIPFVKVALVDHQILASRKHPARQLLNELADAAIGWNEPDDPAQDPLYARMSEVVERVVDTFADDVRVFDKALYEFREYLESERRRAAVVEARTRKAAEGQARVEDAKARVNSAITERLEAQPEPVPEPVRRIVEDAWSKVLFISAVKEGEEGSNWQVSLSVVDRLLWSVQPKAQAGDRQRMLTEMPELLRELRAGLNSVMFDPQEMSQLFRDLETEHLRCIALGEAGDATPAPGEHREKSVKDSEAKLETPAPATLDSEVQLTAQGGDDLPEDSPQQGADSSQAPASHDPLTEREPAANTGADEGEKALNPKLVEQLRAVPLGSWFELPGKDGQPLRAKLSARLNRGQRFVFVDRSGFKLADLPLAALCSDLETERSTMLDDEVLFDRALENVINNLRDMRAGQGV